MVLKLRKRLKSNRLNQNCGIKLAKIIKNFIEKKDAY